MVRYTTYILSRYKDLALILHLYPHSADFKSNSSFKKNELSAFKKNLQGGKRKEQLEENGKVTR